MHKWISKQFKDHPVMSYAVLAAAAYMIYKNIYPATAPTVAALPAPTPTVAGIGYHRDPTRSGLRPESWLAMGSDTSDAVDRVGDVLEVQAAYGSMC